MISLRRLTLGFTDASVIGQMESVLQTSIDGLLTGAVYGIAGVGFGFIYLVIRRLDLAYGACLMAALYVVVASAAPGQISVWLSLAIALPVTAAVMAYSQWLCFPVRLGRPPIAAVAASFALWMQIEEVVTLFMPLHHYAFPADLTNKDVFFGSIAIRLDLAIVALLSIATAVALLMFVWGTREGCALRAGAQNPVAAVLCGISPARLWILTWLVSTILGTVAAISIAAIERSVTPMLGLNLTLKALVVIAIGGTSTIHGPLLGGYILGLFEAHTQAAFGPQIREFATYVFLFFWLALRPPVLRWGLTSLIPIRRQLS